MCTRREATRTDGVFVQRVRARRGVVRRCRDHVVLVLCLGAGLALIEVDVTRAAGPPASPPTSGAVLYRRYCAACHGIEGRGDGPAAGALVAAPTDLTRLTMGVADLMRAIDGRRTIGPHGSPAMPVWGEVFEQPLLGERHQQRTGLLRVQVLADFAHGLQTAHQPPRDPALESPGAK